jgi:uncharacterized protein (TIGR03435 family)
VDIVSDFDIKRRPLLRVAGMLALVTAVLFSGLRATRTRAQSQGQNAASSKTVFEVASIKPDKYASRLLGFGWFSPARFKATGVTTQLLIREAFGIQDEQLSGAPHWIDSERYDVDAKVDRSVADELEKSSLDQRIAGEQRILQALLADRFKLTFHREMKEFQLYALVIAKNGPKLHEAKLGDTYPDGIKGLDGLGGPDRVRLGRGLLVGQGISIAFLVSELSGDSELLGQRLGRPVIDKTGLKGKYDFTLKWTPNENEAQMFTGAEGDPQPIGGAPPAESSGPSIFSAIQEQLGLKLEPQRGPIEVLVIDHVERPSEN